MRSLPGLDGLSATRRLSRGKVHVMSTSLNTTQTPFGLYELDAEGTVLYHRSEPGGEPGAAGPS